MKKIDRKLLKLLEQIDIFLLNKADGGDVEAKKLSEKLNTYVMGKI